MLKGKRILIIEDQALLALLIEDVLMAEEADVVGTAATLTVAFDMVSSALRDRGLDAAVVDLDLAGQSALPVIDLLRSNEVPVVIQTGYADFRSDAPILRKPYAMNDLVATLVEVTRAVRLAA